MFNHAFLFDMDGIICDSHPLHIKALNESMKELDLAHGLCSDFNDLNEFLSETIVGGNERSTFDKILRKYPKFNLLANKLFESAWDKYNKYSQVDSNFPIKNSIMLLKLLINLGHKVCVVSNAKRANILKIIHQLNLNDYLCCGDDEANHLYYGYEDFGNFPKPSPQPYLVAAKKLNTEPKNCIVFEDSLNGIQSAKNAGMYVVALNNNKPSPSNLNMADEIVSNLMHASIFKNLIFSRQTLVEYYNSLRLEVITYTNLDIDSRVKIINKTYGIYSEIFAGRDLTSWEKKLCHPEDFLVRVGLLYDNSDLIGYGLIRYRDLTYKNEQRTIAHVSAGMLNAYRGNPALINFFRKELRRFLLAFPSKKTHAFDNFVSPAGYKLMLSVLKEAYPSVKYPQISKEIADYMIFLSNIFNYKPISDKKPFINQVSSIPKGYDQYIKKVQKSRDQDLQFFINATNLTPGYGLTAISNISFDNLIPMNEDIIL